MTDDIADKLMRETDAITAKIDAAYEKLAHKLRAKADKAKDGMDAAKKDTKRAILRRRFELYGDAAHDIEDQIAERRRTRDEASD